MTGTEEPNIEDKARGSGDEPVPFVLSSEDEVKYYIDLYKQHVDVQMHFNDIEWKIRGLALTVATFSLGAAGLAAKDATKVFGVPLASMVLILGLILWYAFYFVDCAWYHPLLKGAVDKATDIESRIQEFLPLAGMTATITQRSEYKPPWFVQVLIRKKTMHSGDKLNWFYVIGAVALVLASILFAFENVIWVYSTLLDACTDLIVSNYNSLITPNA